MNGISISMIIRTIILNPPQGLYHRKRSGGFRHQLGETMSYGQIIKNSFLRAPKEIDLIEGLGGSQKRSRKVNQPRPLRSIDNTKR